jgi:hypothetical protein
MLKCYFAGIISVRNTFMRKGKDPDPDPLIRGTDPGGPNTCGSCGSGSSTLVERILKERQPLSPVSKHRQAFIYYTGKNKEPNM